MPLTTVEEADVYIKEINKHLDALGKLSVEAGMYSHAAVWHGIHAAFLHSPEEFETIVDMVGMYLEASVERYILGFQKEA